MPDISNPENIIHRNTSLVKIKIGLIPVLAFEFSDFWRVQSSIFVAESWFGRFKVQ